MYLLYRTGCSNLSDHMRPELSVVRDGLFRVGHLGFCQDLAQPIEGRLTYPNCGTADKIYLLFHTGKGVPHGL